MVRMLARQLERLHDRGLIEQKDKKIIKDAIDALKGESSSPVVSDEETAALAVFEAHKASQPNRCPTCGNMRYPV
jgi:hypothetical protein